MDLLLVGAVLVILGVSGSAPPPAEGSLAPRDAARFAVETYNQETETQAVFKLLKFRNTHKTKGEVFQRDLKGMRGGLTRIFREGGPGIGTSIRK
uniref:Uncharacterized protein n=1 Tax=Sphaerodactylus townsendi TaxID=933632 RepID=A0ACB8FW18_9SAUR